MQCQFLTVEVDGKLWFKTFAANTNFARSVDILNSLLNFAGKQCGFFQVVTENGNFNSVAAAETHSTLG